MSVKAVVELGVKGQDVVVNTFKALAKQKADFEKKSTAQVGVTGSTQKAGSEVTPQAGIANLVKLLIAQMKQQGDKKDELTDSEKAAIEEKKAEKEKEKMYKTITQNTKVATGAMETVAKGMASLNPVEFIRSAASATVALTAGLAGGLANTAWTGSGEVVRAIIEHAGKLVDMGIQAAAGALNAYKAALPVELKRRAQTSLIKMAGAQVINNASMTRAESAQMAGVLFPVVGKIGTEFGKQLNKLYKFKDERVRDKKGQGFHTASMIVNRSQANALAQGDFSALGTTKGWLLNQISQSTAGMPPEMVQAFRTGLLSQVSRKELGKESASVRIYAQKMESSDLTAQGKIVAAGNAKWAKLEIANASLNTLQINMIKSVGGLTTILDKAATSLSTLLTTLSTRIDTAKKQAAAESRRAP